MPSLFLIRGWSVPTHLLCLSLTPHSLPCSVSRSLSPSTRSVSLFSPSLWYGPVGDRSSWLILGLKFSPLSLSDSEGRWFKVGSGEGERVGSRFLFCPSLASLMLSPIFFILLTISL